MGAEDNLFVGIDGGGTKTELLAKRPGDERTIQRLGPGSNLQLRGLEGAVERLGDLVDEALHASNGVSLGAICVGLSGAGRADEQEAVTNALAERLSIETSRIRVVSDAEIAVEAAFEGESGVLVVAGTGSMVCGRMISGRFDCVGGWGRILGDEGSGYAIGRAGLQAVAAAVDGGPDTTLVEHARTVFGKASKAVLVQMVYGKDWPLQEFAPNVMEAAEEQDEVASGILKDQTELLARRVQWLTERHEEVSFARRLTLIGGLSNASTYRRAFQEALGEIVTNWTMERSMARPSVGALRLALALG